jgi:3-oxoacyl-[acyl-carrier protein] reductase
VTVAPPASALVSLAGKCALVTGAGGGIGAAVASLLADAGARVAGLDVAWPAGARGEDSIACDVRDPEQVREAVERAASATGRLDVVVHAAGIARDAVIWKTDADAWRDVLATNLDSAFHLLKAAIPRLRAAGGGSVILVASINGQRGKFGQAAYAASKAGLIALGKTAAIECGRFGIRVNAIAPGWIDTAMTARAPESARARAVEESLLGRTGRPEDVAGAALYLASDLSAHVTGQVLRVDGGQLTA